MRLILGCNYRCLIVSHATKIPQYTECVSLEILNEPFFIMKYTLLTSMMLIRVTHFLQVLAAIFSISQFFLFLVLSSFLYLRIQVMNPSVFFP